jgi:hypothetical protein
MDSPSVFQRDLLPDATRVWVFIRRLKYRFRFLIYQKKCLHYRYWELVEWPCQNTPRPLRNLQFLAKLRPFL